MLLLLALGAGCADRAEAPPPQPEPVAVRADDAAPPPPAIAPVTERAVRDLCRAPELLERARKALPTRRLCERDRPASVVEVAGGDRALLIVASPAQEIGTIGAPIEPPAHDRPPVIDLVSGAEAVAITPSLGRSEFWTELEPFTELEPAAARALLEGVLLAFSLDWTITADERAALEERWPRARSVIAEAAPGAAHGAEHRLRAWRIHERLSPGVDCRYLVRREVTLGAGGRIEVAEPERWAEGNEHGKPCGPPLPDPDPEAARCPGETPAPAPVAGEVRRLLRVIAARGSRSGGCFDGFGGAQVRLTEHESWIHDQSADGFAVSVRFRLTRTRLCGDTRGQPGGCAPSAHDIDGCLRVAFERGDDDGYRLVVPERLAGLRTLMMTPLDRTHDGSCFGKSGAFRPRTIRLPAD